MFVVSKQREKGNNGVVLRRNYKHTRIQINPNTTPLYRKLTAFHLRVKHLHRN